METKKAYLVTLAIGAAVGFGAGEYADIQPANARSNTHHVTVEKTIGHAACAGLAAQAENQLCAKAEAEAKYEEGSCAVEDGTIVYILMNKSEVEGQEDTWACTLRTKFAFAETAVKGEPQE